MTAPAERSQPGERPTGGIAQIVRWLTEERPLIAPDDGAGFAPGAPRRAARWTFGDPPAPRAKPEVDPEVLREVRVGPAPRCAVAGETIALSVSLINTRGELYLGWPIRLEWSSSDPSIATVNEYGVVDVRARGRVELTCTCEGVSGSVQLTVVEPEIAVAVGLPVPARLLPLPPKPDVLPRRMAEQPQPPVHRRSIERGMGRHRRIAPLALSRGARRVLFRVAVGAATAGVVAIVLTRSPEEIFVVGANAADAARAERPGRATGSPHRPTVAHAGIPAPVVVASAVAEPLSGAVSRADTAGAPPGDSAANRVVSEAAGAAVITPSADTAAPVTRPVPAPATPAPGVARVVLAPSPSQLAEGESVRLAAAGVDERGETVAGRAVAWKSENEDVAVVDDNGVVTARRPGTVTIVATSDGRAGRVTLTVGARRPTEPPPQPARAAATARENTAAAARQVMVARIGEFVQALQERNGSRVAALYFAESAQDRRNLQALLERLRRPEARLKASEPQVGAPEIREMEAAVDFHVSMSWTNSFGRVRSQTSTFRALLEPGEGGWRLVGIHATGKVD